MDGQDRQDEGKRKKAKGKSLRKKSKVVSASLLPFTFCLSFILFILSIHV
jgi:hypothetical protein